jgi:hypothetical protein
MSGIPIASALGLCLSLAVACATTRSVDAEALRTWPQVMRAVDREFDMVLGAVDHDPPGDLEAAADAARRAAGLVRLGYGPHERKDVRDFARMARDCESWLLGIALEADQGHGALARELLLACDRCARCHDAVEELGR